MASRMSDIRFKSTRLLSLVSGTLLIPLADALALDNLVVALVTGPVENGTFCLPFLLVLYVMGVCFPFV